jgi:hypothetical protein
VSEPVSADGSYHLIKVEEVIPPRVVKLEDVRESVAADLQERLTEAAVRNLRQQVAQRAVADLVINDPVLKQQFDARMEKSQAQLRDKGEIRQELTRQRERMAAEPVAPATSPATVPTTTPAAP